MAKIRLPKGELKHQRDDLKQYQRYLPTLQLKKQQLQIEVLRQLSRLEERTHRHAQQQEEIYEWAGLLALGEAELTPLITPEEVYTGTRNIAGVDIPVYEEARFPDAAYDLFMTPLWVDRALEELRELISLKEEIEIIQKGIVRLRQELLITTQRVNLFEKVKIPEAKEMIRVIKIYIGDQMANAVGRSKIAKRKIERLQEVAV